MHRISSLLAALLLAALTACDFDAAEDKGEHGDNTPDAPQVATEDSGAGQSVPTPNNDAPTSDITAQRVSTPEQTLKDMIRFEKAGDLEQFLACMSKRGRGSYIAELWTGLIMGAHGHNQESAAPLHRLLDKYELSYMKFIFEAWADMGLNGDQICVRFADYVGDRDAAFLRDTKRAILETGGPTEPKDVDVPLFLAGDFRVQTGSNPGILSIELDDGFRFSIESEFVREGDRWLFNGFLEPFDEPLDAEPPVPLMEAQAYPDAIEKRSAELGADADAVLREIVTCEVARDYEKLLQHMTKRAKGFYIYSLCCGLTVGGYANEDYQAGEACRRMLKKYDLKESTFLFQWWKERPTTRGDNRLEIEWQERLADHIGHRDVAFVMDCAPLVATEFACLMPPRFRVVADRFLDRDSKQVEIQHDELLFQVEFVRVSDSWRFNALLGPELVETEPVELETPTEPLWQKYNKTPAEEDANADDGSTEADGE